VRIPPRSAQACADMRVFRRKDMSGEESMVLGHIQASANEGMHPPSSFSFDL
jgi:hypothetical protein